MAADLIADRGLDSVTVRDVAAAIGCSTTVVSHYFSDKRELILLAYRDVSAAVGDHFDAALRDRPDDVVGALEALLPLDGPRRRAWRLWCAFFGAAFADPTLAAEQRARVRSTRTRLAGVLRRAGHDHPDLARSLLATLTGVAVQAVFDEEDWSPQRQRRIMAAEVGRALGASLP